MKTRVYELLISVLAVLCIPAFLFFVFIVGIQVSSAFIVLTSQYLSPTEKTLRLVTLQGGATIPLLAAILARVGPAAWGRLRLVRDDAKDSRLVRLCTYSQLGRRLWIGLAVIICLAGSACELYRAAFDPVADAQMGWQLVGAYTIQLAMTLFGIRVSEHNPAVQAYAGGQSSS